MFERFADRARKTMARSKERAWKFHHDYIGTEHMLLAFVKEEGGLAGRAIPPDALDEVRAEPKAIRADLAEIKNILREK
ncbi:MAG: hypothetical protein GXP25_12015 [Planctomycetes bacterium]|nr:hypothetical protein [Planctomycetota bacterium]